jgi:SAM-dependent methyltransferase
MYERFAFTMEHSAPVEGKTFLDVGCGSGVYSVELAKSRARHVTGIDISPAMLELSRARAEREGVGARCTFVQSDLLAFPADERVDVTIGIGLFDYIRDPLPVLSAMRRITSDTAILSFPRLWTWRAPIRKMRLTLRGCEVYFYSKKRVTELLRDAGFSDITVTKVGKLHCVVVS